MASIVYTLPEATFNNVQGDYNDHRTTKVKNVVYNDNGGSARTPLDRLLEHVAPGAFHDSEERGSVAPKCHPETRTAVQAQIMSWIRHGDQDAEPKQILWLSGPAGSGKTAIAGTIADECDKEGLLAASFFFSAYSGSANRRSKRPFILTLAYALMQQEAIVNLKEAILSAIERDPTVLQKHLDRQMNQLILTPLRKVSRMGQSDPARWPKVIIVDGVDECGGDDAVQSSKSDVQRSREESHRDILQLLARAAADVAFPFRIIVASRPEPAITRFFQTSYQPVLRIFLDDRYDPNSDIRLFLKARLGAIQRESKLPSHWPTQHVIDLLVDRASGQFIYAATVLRFVEDTSRPPQEQLDLVMNWAQHTIHDSNPFASLDTLYSGILHMSPDPALAGKWLVCYNLEWIDGIADDVMTQYIVCPWYRKAILESSPGESTYLLGRLSSLVHIGEDSDGDFSITLYHKSLLDFLDDASRSGNLHVSGWDAQQFIRDGHYDTLKNRGCRGALMQGQEGEFAGDFVFCLTEWIDPFRSYEADDVTWWWTQASVRGWAAVADADLSRERLVRHLFFVIDSECSRYSCRSSCKLWRKEIRQHGKAEKWRRVPAWTGLLRERISKILHADYSESMYDDRPLWHTFQEEASPRPHLEEIFP